MANSGEFTRPGGVCGRSSGSTEVGPYDAAMPSPRITTIILNAEDPTTVAAFWAAFLDVTVQEADDDAGIIWLRPQAVGGMNLGVQRVDHPLADVTQVHVDIAVDDLDQSTARIETLGGRLQRVNRLENGFEWRVMHDPAGHEFCIFVE
jgi:predicted enzyme related to lactoylglutathione lyase